LPREAKPTSRQTPYAASSPQPGRYSVRMALEPLADSRRSPERLRADQFKRDAFRYRAVLMSSSVAPGAARESP
jgi:hypothetical protein